jgi:amidophosphoribosyltransferase
MLLRRRLVEAGSLFQSTSDTEVIVHLIARSAGQSIIDRVVDALRAVEGAWSLVGLYDDGIIGGRDPLGVRPLVLGQLDGAWILASETCALDILGADFARRRFCVFEYVYFSRPDSVVEGMGVYDVRKRIGAELARESGVPADVVVPVPDSGVPGAIGYAQESGIAFELGIIRNHYVGRTFIEPTDHIRNLGVKLKHNANRVTLAGKRVVLVDDSIVRGTTSTKIVGMVRAAGAVQVHMRIASPPTTHSCFYGVDTPKRDKLLAAHNSVAEMARIIGVDSLAFLSIDGLYRAVGEAQRDDGRPQYCDACFTGEYPTRLADIEGELGGAQLSLMLEDA